MVGSRVRFSLDFSTNAENRLGLIWVCVEVKFGGLFMEFLCERRGEEEEKMTSRERERNSINESDIMREGVCVLTWVGEIIKNE